MIEQATSLSQFAPLIAGGVFFALGVNMVIHHYKFKRTAMRLNGIVKAIEKYQSRKMDSQRATQTFYRPIVEYIHEGSTRTVNGHGTGHMRHSLNQKIGVLIRASDDGDVIQDALDDSSSTFMGVLFAALGLAALMIYAFAINGSLLVTLITASTLLGIGYILSSKMLSFENTIIKQADGGKQKKDSIIIDTKAEYLKEVGRHNFWGHAIALPTIAFGIWAAYTGIDMLPDDALNIILSDFVAFYDLLIAGDIPYRWEKPLIIFSIGVFATIAGTHSLLYLRGTYSNIKL